MKRYGNQIKKIHRTDENQFAVELSFEDGARGWASLADAFESPKALSAEILRGRLFSSCFIEAGHLAWPNGFEVSADTLRGRLSSKASQRQAA